MVRFWSKAWSRRTGSVLRRRPSAVWGDPSTRHAPEELGLARPQGAAGLDWPQVAAAECYVAHDRQVVRTNMDSGRRSLYVNPLFTVKLLLQDSTPEEVRPPNRAGDPHESSQTPPLMHDRGML